MALGRKKKQEKEEMSQGFSCLEFDPTHLFSHFSAALGCHEPSLQPLPLCPRAAAGHLAQRKGHLGLAGVGPVV